ncbi:MBL fold metallo-hydrolase [Streptococcus cuniculipharyngis]|uniref:MBL fold metallo-hydrolase n=1 Tax=Streptococcus cuniculipharyngis TaxID=1562651 RepID=A0A5C5SD28_9STRE|nr:MBL fold metallo-hydrolase [Streptococcus cuniculipharyngis]TWS97699.1 MBL fold metallo-hydrolase [Streptococcus cuniculipharyngis]
MKHIQTNNYTITTFTSNDQSFLVTASLIEKEGHAFLINTGFTKSHAGEIVTYLKDNQLELDGIFLIHGDPDYYFGAEVIKAAFPEAIIQATKETQEHIVQKVLGKLAVWSKQLGTEAPVNIVLPQALEEKELIWRGQRFEMVGDSHRINLYDSKHQVLIGGIDTFDQAHVFLADSKTAEEMTAWLTHLEKIAELSIKHLIPSHSHPESNFDKSALVFTKNYLQKAIEVMETSSSSNDFMTAMNQAFPNLPNQGVLGLSSKVVMLEMPWG